MNFTRILQGLGKQQLRTFFHPRFKQNLVLGLVGCRFVSTYHVTRNIELITPDNQPIVTSSPAKILDGKDRPLVVILCWLASRRKDIMKFANLYLEQDFDVITVSITPWQLMWPVKGTRVVAWDLLEFLKQGERYQRIILHGFSVGGYMWGEVLDHVYKDLKVNKPVIDRVTAQVWDSAVDITEMTVGTPRAVFPNNMVMQSMMKKYMEYHMKAFYKQSTQYYIRSSQLFHTNLAHAPALFFMSKADPVGTEESNERVRSSWESLGVTTYVKLFEKSPHVGHYRKYPKEYVAELYAFLDKQKLIQHEEKIRARL